MNVITTEIDNLVTNEVESDSHDSQEEQLAKQLLTLPTFIVAILSLIGSVYVCISAYCLRQYKGRTGPFIITHCVFWMSFCDIFINIWLLLVWTPKIFNSIPEWGDILCSIIGTFGQFFLVASVCWYCVIMYCLWVLLSSSNRIIRRQSQQAILKKISHNIEFDDFSNTMYFSSRNASKSKKLRDWKRPMVSKQKHTLSQYLLKINNIGGILTLIFSSIMTALPWIEWIESDGDITKAYGYVENTHKIDEFECWIPTQIYQWTLYGPIAVYMISALIVLTICLIRFKRVNAAVKMNNDFKKTKKGQLIRRLAIFIIIFWCTWIIPLLVRIWPLFHENQYAPWELVALHHFALGFIGLGNSIVWITSQSFQGFTKSIKYRKMKGNPQDAESPAHLAATADQRIFGFLAGQKGNNLSAPYDSPTYSTTSGSPQNKSFYNSSTRVKPYSTSMNKHSNPSKALNSFGLGGTAGPPIASHSSHYNIRNGNKRGIGGQGGGLGNSKRNAAIARKNSRKLSDYNTSYHSIELTQSHTGSHTQTHTQTNTNTLYDSNGNIIRNVKQISPQSNESPIGHHHHHHHHGRNNNNNNNNNNNGYQPPRINGRNLDNSNSQNETSVTTIDNSMSGDKPTLTPPDSFIQESFSNTNTDLNNMPQLYGNSSNSASNTKYKFKFRNSKTGMAPNVVNNGNYRAYGGRNGAQNINNNIVNVNKSLNSSGSSGKGNTHGYSAYSAYQTTEDNVRDRLLADRMNDDNLGQSIFDDDRDVLDDEEISLSIHSSQFMD